MQENTLIGHYRITSPLGKGGMGEVYLAEDTDLKRQVALKVLPESVRDDPDRLARFRREATAAAQVNHPNIAQIYSIEEADDPDGTSILFIVMEYVDGVPLKDVIPDGGMDIGVTSGAGRGVLQYTPATSFFDIFIPLADALAHAHENHITHRDLKPGNIMIREDGVPKILDFGLARITAPSQPPAEVDTQAPTRTMDEDEKNAPIHPITDKPQFMGTPQYMSPEQASLQELDHRTDLFSFGIIMYEALTGQRPFTGNSQPEIVSSILKDTPMPVREVKPDLPYRVDQIVMRCLRKPTVDRYQSARDLHHDLQAVPEEIEASGAGIVPGSIKRQDIPFWRQPSAIVIAIVMLFIGLAVAWLVKPESQPPLRKFSWQLSGQRFTDGVVISPDGSKIAYVGSDNHAWFRELSRTDAKRITDSQSARDLFWSPNSNSVGFSDQLSGTLKVYDLGNDHTETVVKTALGFYQTPLFSNDSQIIFTELREGVRAVSSEDGIVRTIVRPDSTTLERIIRYPYLLPDGSSMLFVVEYEDGSAEKIIRLTEGNRHTVLEAPAGVNIGRVVYSETGHIIYRYDDQIRALPVHPSTFTPRGEWFTIVQNASSFSLSKEGTLTYSEQSRDLQLVQVNRNGNIVDILGTSDRSLGRPRVSGDGRSVLVSGAEVYDITRRVSLGPVNQTTIGISHSSWSPDGRQVVFSRGNPSDLFVKSVNSSEPMQPLILDTPQSEWSLR